MVFALHILCVKEEEVRKRRAAAQAFMKPREGRQMKYKPLCRQILSHAYLVQLAPVVRCVFRLHPGTFGATRAEPEPHYPTRTLTNINCI